MLAITSRNAEAVIRTAIQHVAGQARNQFAKQNSDILRGVKIIATLDGRTTAYCRAADGTEYALGEGLRPPFHIRCRTSFILLLKDAPSLGALADRSSMNGQIKADTSYYEWIKTQPASFQDAVIGKSRAKLFRDGGMTPEQFADLQIGNNFKPRTLEQPAVLPTITRPLCRNHRPGLKAPNRRWRSVTMCSSRRCHDRLQQIVSCIGHCRGGQPLVRMPWL